MKMERIDESIQRKREIERALAEDGDGLGVIAWVALSAGVSLAVLVVLIIKWFS